MLAVAVVDVKDLGIDLQDLSVGLEHLAVALEGGAVRDDQLVGADVAQHLAFGKKFDSKLRKKETKLKS